MNEISNQNVHGWLMNVPGYRESYSKERRQLMNLNDIKESDETRYFTVQRKKKKN